MDTSAYRAYLKGIQQRIEREAPNVAETAAVAGISLIVQRIQTEGIPGASYSTNKLPAWYFRGRELNAGGAAYLKANQREGVTWGAFRRAQGLQTGFVDGTYSGRTLGGIVVQKTVTLGFRHTASTGGTDRETDKTLGYLAERYGDEVFQPTKEEQEEIKEVIQDGLERLLRP